MNELMLRLDHLSDTQQQQLAEIVTRHSELWISPSLGEVDYVYDIEIQPWHPPLKQSDRRWSQGEAQLIKQNIDELMTKGFIRPTRSPWASRLVLVPKPDGSTRVCVDYRQLNTITMTDAYPTPRVDITIETLSGHTYYTTLDCEKGYYQVKMSEKTKQVTAFTCPFGQFEWTKMPFGLKNAPAIFQRLMDMILSGLTWQSCMVFFDDIVVFSHSWEQHLRDLDNVFTKLKEAHMTLNFKKCEFAQTQLVYLGYLIDKDGMRPNPRKVEAVKQFPVPRTVRDVRSFLGITSYFRRFILNYARISKPISDLVRAGTGKKRDETSIAAQWTPTHTEAFEKLKQELTSDNMLAFPNLNKPFTLSCDASDYAIGAVLTQKDDEGRERPVEYASRLLSDREKRYTVTEREALASVFGTQHFRHYLHGSRFKLITDHSALTYMFDQQDPKGRIARWVVVLQEFDYEIVHRPGKDNTAADALSRLLPDNHDEPTQDMEEELPLPQYHVAASRVLTFDDRRKRPRQTPEPIQSMDDLKKLLNEPAKLSPKTWRAAQEADPICNSMIKWLEEHTLLKDHQDLHQWICTADTEYEMVQQILCRRVKLKIAGNVVFRMVPVVPKMLQAKVVIHAHAVDNAHMSVTKTFDWIRRRFWWSGYYTQTKSLIAQCTTCQCICSNGNCSGRGQNSSKIRV